MENRFCRIKIRLQMDCRRHFRKRIWLKDRLKGIIYYQHIIWINLRNGSTIFSFYKRNNNLSTTKNRWQAWKETKNKQTLQPSKINNITMSIKCRSPSRHELQWIPFNNIIVNKRRPPWTLLLNNSRTWEHNDNGKIHQIL